MTFAIRDCALLALLVACLAPLGAQEERWVETNSWQGTGNFQTEIFFVTADQWRVVYRAKGKGPFRMVLHREGGNDPVVVSNQQGPPLYSGRRSFRQPGRRYLEIASEDTGWEVAVEQLLTPLAEWRLVQLIRKERLELVRVATWTGGAGAEEFEVQIPRGSWALFATVEGEGKLDLAVAPTAGENDGKATEMKQIGAGKGSTRIHRSGTFLVRTQGGGNCRWQIDVCVPK